MIKNRTIFNWIVSLAIIAEGVGTPVLAVDSKRDSVIPSQPEATAILQAICGRENVFANRERGGKLACKSCPSFTGVGNNRDVLIKPPFTLEKVVYGSFTQAGTREALADFDGCEAHARNNGGSVLLQRLSQGWSAVRYESGLRSNNCLKFPNKSGRDLLVCQSFDAHMGRFLDWLDALQINSLGLEKISLIRLLSNIASNRPPIFETRIENWTAQDVNNDNLLDLVVTVREANSAQVPPGFEGKYDSHLPNPTFHRLTFLFDGQSFQATPETAQLKQRFEEKFRK
ncbi:MAG: hypothetical protein ACM37W_03995 [Actinomycetota bacterium]